MGEAEVITKFAQRGKDFAVRGGEAGARGGEQSMSGLAVEVEVVTAICAARVLIRQLRGLLVDIGNAIRAWRSVRDALRDEQEEHQG
ncbi:hypothetical protein OG266_23335 [Streptomyces sp. NBC_00554]|uniref:hypothetical protein n=2 Tax=Streptomyces TaxID=1883 RepID=UPI00352F84ED|nr:hypothetical protein OG266_23335 [Streptomyces sp. NBC_00554]